MVEVVGITSSIITLFRLNAIFFRVFERYALRCSQTIVLLLISYPFVMEPLAVEDGSERYVATSGILVCR